MRAKSAWVAVAAVVWGAACGSNNTNLGAQADGGGQGSGSGGGSGNGGSSGEGGQLITVGDDGPSFGDALPDSFVGCATDTEQATIAPLDLFFMLDTSGSMDDLVAAGQSKWSAVVAALTSFVNDPASAGIGVGLQYFPLTAAGLPATCTSTAQCGSSGPCILSICTTDPRRVAGIVPCDTVSDCKGLPCLNGACQCQRVGVCHNDHNALCFPGNDCAPDNNNFPLGTCDSLATSTCLLADSCSVGDYSTPAVPIAVLPGAAAGVTSSLGAHQPGGNTPTAAALGGALDGAATYAIAHPGHSVVAVLATDGIPDECTPSDIASIAKFAATGLANSPSVKTFAIGVFTPDAIASGTAALNQIAASGGTGKAFIIGSTNSSSGTVEQQFNAALSSIRGASLPCQYVVPKPADGGVADFNKLNAQYTSGTGAVTAIPYVKTPAQCNPTSGGWYYDTDPATGGVPMSIVVCPATCTTIAGDPKGRVDVVLGCQTIER